ncbi:MarR family winged helix-turn-helix transcriptional regulator [Streptomyces sp. SL13]|uniref:MarR family winged helix-turn-helix transcriptional regulator n=1 Tax=Streptantibioticus silvisoli TaxID=2705255 RepID=A0AA90H7S2_9ACTN|nr:MarR family winged helix-turn-helix transcriptional regulator [Streptantibioticus silvisoli]MDI5966791.1 MarR family winged helix-turn-helix transcriptional regulator [Streptantibioticus silvisoli]MDI5972488.1 MarR family winged helix-turn-helix transcriptional regulator [Streptantibioticus silvisoli]
MTTAELPSGLAEVLAGIQRLVRRRVRRDVAGPRLRGAQTELLALVAERPGIGVSAAAKELYLAGNSVSTLVNQLTAAGLLSRGTDPGDRRSALLRPTADGLARLADWRARRGELVARQVAAMSGADQALLAAALPALRRLAQRLHEEVEGT